MAKKKSIVVKLDRNDNLLHTKGRLNSWNNDSFKGIEELAAKKNPNDNIRTLAKQYQIPSSKKRKEFPYKPIFFASFAAILIGSIFGVILLNMMGYMEGDAPAATGQPSPIQTALEDKSSSPSSEIDKVTIDMLRAHVLQGGVFSTEANAKAAAEPFRKAGYPPVIWKRDNQFYVLAGIAETADEAEWKKNNMKEHQLETYVKQWQVESADVNLTSEEYSWLKDFQEVWKDSIADSQFAGMQKRWNDLLTTKQEDVQQLLGFIENLKGKIEDLDKENTTVLLQIWQDYEALLLQLTEKSR